MQVVYGFVYYFILIFITLTALLAVFILPSARRLLHKLQTKYQSILNNSTFKYLVNFSFCIIALILVDSIKSYLSLNTHFKERNFFKMQMNTPLLESDWKELTLSRLKLENQCLAYWRNIENTILPKEILC